MNEPSRFRRAIVVAALLATLLGIAELPFSAFMADDLIQLSALEGVLPCPWAGPFTLYTISDGVPAHVRAMQDAGAVPWFVGPGFQMTFFRPLSSASLALDHALWGLWPMGYRLQGACWFVLLVVGFGLVLRRTPGGPVGELALLVFTISAIHGILFWNATRHVVVAGALATLGLAAHVESREVGWRAGRVVSLAGFALALCASEAALAVLAYLFAYEALSAPGSRRVRLRAAAPALVLVAAYLLGHRLAGFGAVGGGYLDPMTTPLAFLVALPARVLFLMGSLVAGGGADLWILRPGLQPVLVFAAGVLVVGFAWLLRSAWGEAPPEERRAGRWLVAGAVAATVPFVGTPIGNRCLVLPMLGAAFAIALVLRHWWTRGFHVRIASVAAVLLAVVHVVIAPVGRLSAPYVLREMLHGRLAGAMHRFDGETPSLDGRRIVVLRAPDFMLGLHPFFFRALHRLPLGRSWRTLSWAAAVHRFTRTGPETLVLDLRDGTIDAPDLALDQMVALEGMRATVTAREAAGPTRVRFDFDRPLDAPGLLFLTWRGDRLEPVEVPEVGADFRLD